MQAQRDIGLQVHVPDRWLPAEIQSAFKTKHNPLAQAVKSVLKYVRHDMPGARDAVGELLERLSASIVLQSNLNLTAIYANGRVEPFGSVGWKVVTTAGVNYLVDAWQNSVELENLKYHGIGTGSTAEAVGDTTLVTELTTEYNPDSTRATGSLTEGASANIFRTVGTNTLDGTPGATLREHGVFSAASAGTLWDRTVYSAITLSSGDSLQSTYDATCTAGG